MKRPTVSVLLREARLERVERDLDTARAKIEEARRHLVSAEAIAEGDPEGAYALLYDAARKAVDAHMVANGYRVPKGRLGAHQATALYASAALRSDRGAEHVSHFDLMRRNRNRSEYAFWAVGSATVARDLAHARGIVTAVEKDLELPGQGRGSS